MTNEEKYYRRAYSLLEDLSSTYKNGFNKDKTYKFWKEKYSSYLDKPSVISQQQSSLLLTILISLIGLNKESIEKNEVIKDYDYSFAKTDFRKALLKKEDKERIVEFDNLKNKSTVFDSWLSIIKGPDDNSNIEILKRVRNGLLHSNFYVDMNTFQTTFTHIKTKSYYDAMIFNENFYLFVMSYFGNGTSLGICDEDYFFQTKEFDVKNDYDLVEYLADYKIIKIKNNIEKYDGTNTISMKANQSLSKNKKTIYLKKFVKLINKDTDNVKIDDLNYYTLNKNIIIHVLGLIKIQHPDFYELPHNDKMRIIKSNISYIYNSKAEISNWLVHFFDLIMSFSIKNFNVNNNFYKYDEFANVSCNVSLSILKAYLVLYRLQNIKENESVENDKFDEVNYLLVNFDFDDDFYMWSEDSDGMKSNAPYTESFKTLRQKYVECTLDEIKSMLICDVIRNALAHGNIKTFMNEKGKTIIELRDVNPKSNTLRALQIDLDKFDKLLDSPAFYPQLCYKIKDKVIKK